MPLSDIASTISSGTRRSRSMRSAAARMLGASARAATTSGWTAVSSAVTVILSLLAGGNGAQGALVDNVALAALPEVIPARAQVGLGGSERRQGELRFEAAHQRLRLRIDVRAAGHAAASGEDRLGIRREHVVSEEARPIRTR